MSGMAWRAGVAALALALGPLWVEEARASRHLPCADYAQIVRLLAERYGEQPAALGLQTNGWLLQLFVSKEQRSWTMVSVSPEGIGCVLAAGRDWRRWPGAAEAKGPDV